MDGGPSGRKSFGIVVLDKNKLDSNSMTDLSSLVLPDREQREAHPAHTVLRVSNSNCFSMPLFYQYASFLSQLE
jgi:hypothetical protein